MNVHKSRVVHVTTTCEGGAGLAAIRLHQALLGIEYSSIILSRFLSADQRVIPDVVQLRPSILKRGVSKGITAVDRIIDKGDFSLFTPLSVRTLQGLASYLTPNTVVNIHNAFNFVDWKTISELRSRRVPVVLTLHDQRWFTGGCHYSQECSGFLERCQRCPRSPVFLQWAPERNMKIAREVTRRYEVTVISPSRWLAGVAETGSVFRGHTVHVIPNPLPSDFRIETMKSAGQPESDVFWVAWLPGKGDDLFQQVVNTLEKAFERGPRIGIVTTTASSVTSRSIPIRRILPLKTECDRQRFWSSAHVSVLTTEGDNFPNVVIESLAVGTPMLVPLVGGANEAVKDTGGGLVVDRTPEAFSEALIRLAVNPSILRELSEAALIGSWERYQPDIIAQQYAAVYNAALTSL